MSTKFVVPQEEGYADLLASYLDLVKDQLYQYSGRVWYTGKKALTLTSQAMGKNSVSKIPHEIAALLKLADPSKYTFHSFRRTSATRAADGGDTSEQLVDFYSWKNSFMCVRSTSPPVSQPSWGWQRLSSQSSQEVTVNGDTLKLESEEEQVIADMEEDNDMLENAGISSQRSFNESGTGQQCLVEATIKEVMSAIPGNKRADIKVFVINKMSGNINL